MSKVTEIIDNVCIPKATILDLNDAALENICQNLDQSDLFALRDAHSRFTHATEVCYKKLDAENLLEFRYEKRFGDLEKILQHFGHCMTRVHIDEIFTEFVKVESISQTFLSERLSNVRYLKMNYVDRDEVEFVSTLPHICELEVNDIVWMPFHGRWPHLKKFVVAMSSLSYLSFDEPFLKQLIAFLLAHKHVQKLGISIYTQVEGYLLKLIATNMRDLIELDLSTFEPNKNIEMIFMLEKLETLKLASLDELEWLKRLKNLKYLSLESIIRVDKLYEIVEYVPTLTDLRLSFNGYELDTKALEKLIEKRKLSPICETQILRITNPYEEDAHEEYIKQNEKYVFCKYSERDYPGPTVENIGIGGMSILDVLALLSGSNYVHQM